MPRVGSPLLGDAAVIAGMLTRLMHAWIQAEVGNECVGAGEPVDPTDGSHDAHRHNHVEAGNLETASYAAGGDPSYAAGNLRIYARQDVAASFEGQNFTCLVAKVVRM